MSAEIIASWILQNACQYLLAGVLVGVISENSRRAG
jgi:hypothetical protein